MSCCMAAMPVAVRDNVQPTNAFARGLLPSFEKRAASALPAAQVWEETPKEGGDNAPERATALRKYATASHKRQGGPVPQC